MHQLIEMLKDVLRFIEKYDLRIHKQAGMGLWTRRVFISMVTGND